MPKFTVESRVKYKGKIREVGDAVDMPKDIAEPLLALGRISKGGAGKPAPETSEGGGDGETGEAGDGENQGSGDAPEGAQAPSSGDGEPNL